MDCFQEIVSGSIHTRQCLSMCKPVLDKSKHKLFICNPKDLDLFVKVGDIGAQPEEQMSPNFHITKEYRNYLHIQTIPEISNIFVNTPVLYKDEIGTALIFDNRGQYKSVDLYQLLRLKQVDLVFSLFSAITEMILKINDHGICHGDIHFGNIIYNVATKEIHLIDLEKMEFGVDASQCNDIKNLNKYISLLQKHKHNPKSFLKQCID